MASAKPGRSFYSPPGLVTYTFFIIMYEPSLLLLLLIIEIYNGDGCDHPPRFVLLCDGKSTSQKNPGRVPEGVHRII
jgi:hypothetical protein